jgi:hypothetical protein
VLPEFAETGAAKATVGAVFFLRFWDEIRKVLFDISLDTGSGAAQSVEAQEFVGDELIVGRGLEGHKLPQECDGAIGPTSALVAAAGFEREGFAVF